MARVRDAGGDTRASGRGLSLSWAANSIWRRICPEEYASARISVKELLGWDLGSVRPRMGRVSRRVRGGRAQSRNPRVRIHSPPWIVVRQRLPESEQTDFADPLRAQSPPMPWMSRRASHPRTGTRPRTIRGSLGYTGRDSTQDARLTRAAAAPTGCRGGARIHWFRTSPGRGTEALLQAPGTEATPDKHVRRRHRFSRNGRTDPRRDLRHRAPGATCREPGRGPPHRREAPERTGSPR